MFWKYISWPVFLVSLAVGLFMVYVWGPEMREVYVYPTPENVGKIQYMDHAGGCFEYTYRQRNCNGGKNVCSVPVQNG